MVKAGTDIDLLLECGKHGSAAICSTGNQDVIEYLIENGAEVNLRLKCGVFGSVLAAAITAASSSKNIKIARYLVWSGADAT